MNWVLLWLALAPYSPAENGKPIIAVPSLQSVVLTGFTRAYAALDLAAEVAGKCTWVVGDVGAVLDDEGQFARLDDTFIQLDLARNHAEQERLQSRIDFLAGDMKRFEDLLERRTVSQAL